MAVPTQQTPTAAPDVCCQECNQPMRADFNPPMLPGRQGDWLLTCDTPACGLAGVTLNPRQLPLTAELADDYRAQNAVRQSFPTRR